MLASMSTGSSPPALVLSGQSDPHSATDPASCWLEENGHGVSSCASHAHQVMPLPRPSQKYPLSCLSISSLHGLSAI